ncbi:MAG: hypothetical protein ACLTV6_06755 [Christensenellales bacterium]
MMVVRAARAAFGRRSRGRRADCPRKRSYTLTGAKGSTVSLLPLGEARGISVRGCYYTIEDFTLASDTSRGVSNVVTADEAVFTVREGDLMLFHYSDIHGHGENA